MSQARKIRKIRARHVQRSDEPYIEDTRSNEENITSQIGNRAVTRLLGQATGDKVTRNDVALSAGAARAINTRVPNRQRQYGASAVQRTPMISRDNGGPRSYEQQQISYRTHEYDRSILPIVGTTWGTNLFGSIFGDGKSGFHSGHFLPEWSSSSSVAGIRTMTVVEPTRDYRANNFSNDDFNPETTAHVSWEHQSADAALENVTGTLEYNPDGGGGMQITVLYHYGGFVEEDGIKKGQHNIRLVFTYDTKMTESSSIEFGGEFGGKPGKISAKASSSTSVGKAARTWKRDIAFESVPAA